MLYGVIASRHADILAEYEKVKMYTITRQKSSAADRSKTTKIRFENYLYKNRIVN
jgi:hypothetical protein